MKKKLCLFIALVLLLSTLAACAKIELPPSEPTGSSSESDSSTEEPTEKPTRKPKETKPADFDDEGNITLDGWSDYVIVRGAECTDSEKTAAIQIRNYIKKISGATLDVITDVNAPAEKEIVVGKTNRENEGEFDREELGDEGFVIKTRDKKLFIVGGEVRGTLYGAYTYLEECLGCRFYTPTFEKVPTIDPLPFIEIEEIKQLPVFETRNVGWKDSYDYEFSSKLKINGSHGRGAISSVYGGSNNFAGSPCHTLYRLAEMNGDEFNHEPCLSDEQVYQTVLKNVRALLSSNPNASYISVSQNDSDTNDRACKCSDCMALFEQTGSRAGNYLTFVNRIAEEIKDEYPNVMIHTFAYKFTKEIPTGVKPADNVMVQFCTIEACFRHALDECTNAIDKKTDFEKLIKDWAGICDYLAVWDYTTNFSYYNMPFPNFEAMRNNVRLFAENNVKYVYEQGNHQDTNGEFSELRSYLLAKLLWNPYMSEEEYYSHMNDFINDYYGEGGAKIREYIDLLMKSTENKCFTIYNDPAKSYGSSTKTVREDGILPTGFTEDNLRNYKKVDWSPYYDWYEEYVPHEIVKRGRQLFDEAYALASDPITKAHIKKSSIQIDILEIYFENNRIATAAENARRVASGLAAELMKGGTQETFDFIGEAVKNHVMQQIKSDIVERNKALFDKLVEFGIDYNREGRLLSSTGKYDFAKLPHEWVN